VKSDRAKVEHVAMLRFNLNFDYNFDNFHSSGLMFVRNAVDGRTAEVYDTTQAFD
jgi:hypothetical protein